MKYIKKGKAPQALKDWVRANKAVPDAQYGTHGFPTTEVREALLTEQGGLCAYTMVPMTGSKCHVEHIKPQAQSRASNTIKETYDYKNLVACYPGNEPPGHEEFGANKKGDAWDEKKFVSPLKASCEQQFRFSIDGGVCAAKAKGNAGWTIDVLGLDCAVLTEWRRAAIEGAGFSLTAKDSLSRAEAEALRKCIRERRSDGSFNGYCIAIDQAAAEYIALLDKRGKKKRYAAKSRASRGK